MEKKNRIHGVSREVYMDMLMMKPVMKEMIWGGNRMRDEFGYELPGEQTGECWAVSAHAAGDCRVTVVPEGKESVLEGKYLSELWREHRELFGGMEGEVFPLLTKIIDAAADLSIQVHPDDAYAAEHENGALGKTECWYILDCDPGATIIIGHHARSKEELRQMIEEERFGDLIREIPVHPGDFFQIEPGCVHAIKGGTLLLETQQSSDITYRLYDYGRLQNGKPRELHLAKSMDVITCPMQEQGQERRMICETADGSYVEHLVKCPFYTVERIGVKGRLPLTQIREQGSVKFDIFSVIDGMGTLDGVELKKGDHFILPYGYPDAVLEGEMELIHAVP